MRLSDREVQERKARYEREFDRHLREIPGLAVMVEGFNVQSPATRYYVLNSPDPGLNGLTPLEALTRIRDLIAGYGEQGGS